MDDVARGEVTAERRGFLQRSRWAGVTLAAFVAAMVSAEPPQKPAKPTRPAAPRPSAASPTPRPTIRVEIEQEGRVLPLLDHRVVLKRAPFDILLTLAAGESVLLRASSRGELFEDARQGRPLGGIFNPYQSGAEAGGNPDRELWLDRATVQHSLFHDPKEAGHRFNEVVPRGSLFRCRRSVATLADDDPVAIASYGGASLYLVFLAGPSSKKGDTTVETAREFLMLTFDDATADVLPPGLPSKQGPMESLLALVFAKDVATVKAYLPEGLKAQAARRSPVEQQLFFEGLRFAENTRVQGGRIERRGKPNKPEIRLDSDRLSGKVVCDKERIAGDRADIECKGRASTSKEDRPFRVRMVAQQGRWRVSGFEVVGAGEGTWSQLEDGQIFERLDASQRQANESRAIMDLRSLISAQAYVTSINGGFYLSPECLEALEACVSGYAGPPAMEPPFSWVIPRNGYRFTFKAGSRPSSQELRKAKASASSLASFALVAVPEMPGKSGTRGFCGDASGVICETPDGSPPAVRNGSCVLPCSVLR